MMAENIGTKFAYKPADPGPIRSTPRIKKIWDKNEGMIAIQKTIANPLNGVGVRDKMLEPRMKVTESTAYFWGNFTKGVQETGKGALTIDSGKRAGTGIFKASTDFARGDTVYGGLCSVLDVL